MIFIETVSSVPMVICLNTWFEDFLTIIESNFVGNGTDFSNVGVKVRLDANVTNVENGCKDAAYLFKLL